MPLIHILPAGIDHSVSSGANLMESLRSAGIFLDAPCGGNGRCGKCIVAVDGVETLACQTTVEQDMQVRIPEEKDLHVMHSGIETETRMDPLCPGPLLAIDIGTTSVVCFLLDGSTGKELASASTLNPQTAFGADVISRIREALSGKLEVERDIIREELTKLSLKACADAQVDPSDIGVVSVVGNPAMQQLFLGISPENLAGVPFEPLC